jgi:hypothetical protein
LSDADRLRWLEIELGRDPLPVDASVDERLARLEALVVYLTERCDALNTGFGKRLNDLRKSLAA